MCLFITLVVRGSDHEAIAPVLKRHGRTATPIYNSSVAKVMAESEAQFLTTVRECDCGTALAGEIPHDADHTQQAAKLARKGWSQAKVERWLTDRRKGETQRQKRRDATAPDSIELWANIVRDVLAVPGVIQAGLLLHFYSGDLESEVFRLTRCAVDSDQFAARLLTMREDELVMTGRHS